VLLHEYQLTIQSCQNQGSVSARTGEASAMDHSALSDIRKLAPLIAKHADEAERERRLSRPVVDGLVDAGIFKLLTPPALGGAGASPMEFCEVVEAVSAIDGSTAGA
jgi:alkylation response protein AidB-like acyl-CoA dehydrogenase